MPSRHSRRKVNAKTDKKLDYEAAKAVGNERPLSARVASLKQGCEAVRHLKELAISSGKSGSISAVHLKDAIMKVQSSMQELQPATWIGFPCHWVQAGKILFMAAGCLCYFCHQVPLQILGQIGIELNQNLNQCSCSSSK